MICKYCDSEIENNSLYCPFCGNKVVISKKNPGQVKPKKNKAAGETRRPKPLIILLAAVVCFLMIGFLVVGLLTRDNTGASASMNLGLNGSQQSEETADTLNLEVEKKLAEMSVEEKVAQLFIITPDQMSGLTGTVTLHDKMKTQYAKYPVGGFLFYEENLKSAEQVRSFTTELKKLGKEEVGLEPFLAVDEEGGDFTVLDNMTDAELPFIPNMIEVGATGDTDYAAECGSMLGDFLIGLGFNVDFAPIADVNITDEVMERERMFSSDPKVVAEMVAAEAAAMEEKGISATLKHFPGQGAAVGRSENGTLIVERTLLELRRSEFLPFEAGIEAGADFVMMGHVSLPNVTGNDGTSTLSSLLVTDVLRKELGFDGIIITSSMRRKFISDNFDSSAAAVAAIQAGNDMILLPANYEKAYNGVLSAVEIGTISEDRIDESIRRILKVKLGYNS